jgi:hypothetical protein
MWHSEAGLCAAGTAWGRLQPMTAQSILCFCLWLPNKTLQAKFMHLINAKKHAGFSFGHAFSVCTKEKANTPTILSGLSINHPFLPFQG